ncbi:pyridoxamine 5'-phosphate oxidase family protein [Enhygromyxa salina]|uniref:Pyridoxamine 5'-phosphate oxidase n=1 Tax=Enhygromyxa salina TaxID=215803 RepID=A0A2S9YVH5_9BACT|nr:pyridoxamine 5'-phosphate oxidase family protein [Enhygromyxa salina]PRQ09098.1 Pyridoxamine 5'-phosphate oxidase [Enhygromyxa salina]
MRETPSDIAFSDAVKAAQTVRGSRAVYEKATSRRPWPDRLTPEAAAFLAARDSVFLGTASRAGQPYIQHRGAPPGFLKLLDAHTIGLADYAGNRQYVTVGNLSENPAAFLFAMDFEARRRLKLWGTARVVEGDAALMDQLRVEGGGRAERAILFEVRTWDANCPQHIPMLLPAERVARVIAAHDARIAELEAEIARLRLDASRVVAGHASADGAVRRSQASQRAWRAVNSLVSATSRARTRAGR